MLYFSIFDDYEILGDLSNQMYLDNKVGSLFVDILNNYSHIKQCLEKSMTDILKTKDKHKISNYLHFFVPYTSYMSNMNYNLKYFYDIIQFKFGEDTENFLNMNLKLSQELNILTKILEHLEKEDDKYSLLYNHKENLENELKNYSFRETIKNQLMYIDSLLNDFELIYIFINKYSYVQECDYFFKAFEIPREMISCVMQNKNKIRLLESKQNSLCGSVKERNSIENNPNNNIKYLTSYQIEKANDLFEIYRKLIIEKKICIKKCSNCNKYFITSSRTDEKYCNNPSPQNFNKTCKEYGAKKRYRDEIKSIPIKYEHNKTSQFYRMRINRAKEQKEKEEYEKYFNIYKENYQKKKAQYKLNKLKEDDFVEWIINQKSC